jgi:xylulokinase
VSAQATLVAGIDSSTQSCKVVIRDASAGALVREGRADHPDGTEIDPRAWWDALRLALAQAGGLDDVTAIAVAGQQHGMVCLDEQGEVIRPALLWNDTRSAGAAADLVAELGDGDAARGAQAWANAVGSVPVASFTVTKLRWLAEHEPDAMARTAVVCLPHDWLTWQLSGRAGGLDALRTDRSDASGTGYWSPGSGAYRLDLLSRACGRPGRMKSLAWLPAPSGRATAPDPLRPCSGPVPATMRRPRWASGSVPATWPSPSVPPALSSVCAPRPPPTPPASLPGSLTPPASTCRSCAR